MSPRILLINHRCAIEIIQGYLIYLRNKEHVAHVSQFMVLPYDYTMTSTNSHSLSVDLQNAIKMKAY